MTAIHEEKGFKISFNGSKTYFVECVDTGDAWYSVDTERKDRNRLNKILKDQGKK